MSGCAAQNRQDKGIIPKAIGRIRKGDFCIPDCPDYKSRINIPRKVKVDEVFVGWNCCNCKNFRSG